MGYIISIKAALLLFPIVSFLFTIPFVLNQYHKYGSINKIRVLIVYSFILYMLTIYFLVILPLPNKETLTLKEDMVHLVPFGFIFDLIRESSFELTNPRTYLTSLLEPCFYTVVLNIIMTIPFGMYLRYYYKCNLQKTIFLSFLLSLFFETTQITGLYFIYPYPYRVFDIDDLMMNTLGGVLGYLIMGMINRYLPSRDKIDEESLEKGMSVSGLRRITVFCLDFFSYCFLTLLFSMFYNNHVFFIMFVIYYVIPYIFNKQTLGGKFLNVKLEFKDNNLIKKILFPFFLYLYYFGLPYGLIIVVYLLSHDSIIWLYIIAFFIILLFYIVSAFKIVKNRKIFYDDIFGVKFKSTIKEIV